MRSELKGTARKEFLHCPLCMSSAGCPPLSYSAFRPTLHMRAATRVLSKLPVYTVISTRAPHEVERPVFPHQRLFLLHFNPRSPHGERRQISGGRSPTAEFQSTLPVRGATYSIPLIPPNVKISIHAPRAGSDAVLGDQKQGTNIISIHAPRAGSDLSVVSFAVAIDHFNPRSPCGERQLEKLLMRLNAKFQSTLPVRGATIAAYPDAQKYTYFNPRSPCGERRRARRFA